MIPQSIVIPNWLISVPCPPACYRILCFIQWHQRTGAEPWSLSDIRHHLKMSRHVLVKGLRWLEKEGWIDIQPSSPKRNPCVYCTINWLKLYESSDNRFDGEN